MIGPVTVDFRSALRDTQSQPPSVPTTPISPIGHVSPIIETIAPPDEAAIASAIRQAFECRHAVYTLGGGTSVNYGLPRVKPGIAVSLAALNRVLDYPADGP